MTLRVKPVARQPIRPSRPPRESADRRTFFVNLGFVVAIVAAVLILAGAVASTWYEGHLAPAAKVDGVAISKDQFAARLGVESFRIDYAESRVRTMVGLGYLTADQETSQISYIDSARQSVTSIALERLVDGQLQSRLAADAGITASDAEIDAQIVKESTIPEQRHAWVIEVAPVTDVGASGPTDAQKAEAKAKADKAAADLQAGKPWAEVATAVSTADFTGEGGDVGYISADVSYDALYLDTIFKAAVNTPTAVLEGTDGTYRIGQVTDVGAAQVDATYLDRLDEAKIKREDYRLAVKADVIRTKLEAKVVGDLSQPSAQRHFQEIYIQTSTTTPPADAIKVRHILYAPNGDTTNAATVLDTDPAWKAAEDKARATYATLKADITQFDAIARKESNEAGAATTGGKLPYYDPTSALDQAFADAIFAAGLKPGDLLEPVKSGFGWHVIQILHGPTDGAWVSGLKTQLDAGASFTQLAKDNSDAVSAANGGDGGWISRGELKKDLEDAVFKTAVGTVSDPVVVSGDGLYLMKVLAEEVRSPTPAQLATYKSSGFSNWYTPKKDAANIERLIAVQ